MAYDFSACWHGSSDSSGNMYSLSAKPLVDEDLMKSTNFEFLRPSHPELADLGGFAERYAFSDPASALVKLRMFAETMVSAIYCQQKLPRPFQFNLNDMLNETMFVSMTPKTVRYKLHELRVQGNKAAHGAEAAVRRRRYPRAYNPSFPIAQGGRQIEKAVEWNPIFQRRSRVPLSIASGDISCRKAARLEFLNSST